MDYLGFRAPTRSATARPAPRRDAQRGENARDEPRVTQRARQVEVPGRTALALNSQKLTL